jgi:hypothetical protein
LTAPDRLASALADRYRIERQLGQGGRLETVPALKVAGTSRLFTAQGFLGGGGGAVLYDVSRDGGRFLMLDITAAPANAASERVVLVQDFAAELAKRAAEARRP